MQIICKITTFTIKNEVQNLTYPRSSSEIVNKFTLGFRDVFASRREDKVGVCSISVKQK